MLYFFLLSWVPRVQNLPLQYIYAMVFAVEEINHSTNLLPGIKLGYHIRDNCGLPQWALQAALLLVGGDSTNCNTRALQSGYGQERGNKSSFGILALI